eukprot:CAMPEP_0197296942 /NCGR_PEP_ID=MMETSP0890-20130614/39768_1 /TAXON_ID=44058 ORGANISM="Aureoumbra lagunensis, Strain CCMP1510" /NCGR_SAMPLE_ID=MMETSP0890 /ASSEMBLY_ACC=CAM_ASM_000533 /LENGTH=708 /DNA_ID=CAMNT_0042773795 /DNA_START=131 /DNA_END=2258 /DNA_ORIENTATION=-
MGGTAVSEESSSAELALLDKTDLPRFAEIDESQVVPGISKVISSLEVDIEKLEASLAVNNNPRYDDVVSNAEKISEQLEFSFGVVSHLNGVKNSDALREAHQEMLPKVVGVSTKMSQSLPMYKALEALENDKNLDGPKKRIVESKVKSMRLSGVGLQGEDRDRFNKNRARLSELSTEFGNNVLDATKEFKLKITDKEQVRGLPKSALSLAAERSGVDGATADDGPWVLGLDMPSYLPSMKYLKIQNYVKSFIELLFHVLVKKNEPIIKEILTLRQEQAQLLGKKNHAEVSLAMKMAGSVDKVDELTNLLAAKAIPAAKKEMEELITFAQQDAQLKHWDIPYFSEKLREQTFGFSEEDIRPYMALDTVLDGMFDLLHRLFGIRVIRADGEAQVWNNDVRFFKVFVADDEPLTNNNFAPPGTHIASFYLDPYARPENKRGGAWMDTCIGKSRARGREIPVAYLTCNSSPPSDGKPSLMTFGEVETLFHETGHGLQHMLTQVDLGDAAGISNVEWDAVELPSQFMENFLYHKPTLDKLARHYETGEPLPNDLFEKIKAAKNFHSGMIMCRQLAFSSLDMELYARYDPTSSEKSPFDIQTQIFTQYLPMPPLPEDRFLAAFSHIFAGGYSAGYYSYKWAEVLSADSFAAFEEAGLDDPDAVAATGRRFRDTVLALGGSVHPAQVFRAFRGRDPSPEALLRHSGLLDNDEKSE